MTLEEKGALETLFNIGKNKITDLMSTVDRLNQFVQIYYSNVEAKIVDNNLCFVSKNEDSETGYSQRFYNIDNLVSYYGNEEDDLK